MYVSGLYQVISENHSKEQRTNDLTKWLLTQPERTTWEEFKETDKLCQLEDSKEAEDHLH